MIMQVPPVEPEIANRILDSSLEKILGLAVLGLVWIGYKLISSQKKSNDGLSNESGILNLQPSTLIEVKLKLEQMERDIRDLAGRVNVVETDSDKIRLQQVEAMTILSSMREGVNRLYDLYEKLLVGRNESPISEAKRLGQSSQNS